MKPTDRCHDCGHARASHHKNDFPPNTWARCVAGMCACLRFVEPPPSNS